MINITNKTLQGKTFIDICAGIGGIRLAFESYGAKCIFSSEIDKYALETYSENFEQTEKIDITKIDPTEIPAHDILCAGFPCQPFSISGLQNGFEDARGTIFFNIAAIIDIHRPSMVFLENVGNLLSHDKGNTFSVIKNTLVKMGYNVQYKVFNGTDFNMPQNRKRIYIVATLPNISFTFPTTIGNKRVVKDILEKNIVENLILITDPSFSNIIPDIDTPNYKTPKRLAIWKTGSQGQRAYSINAVGITLTATGGGKFGRTGGYVFSNGVRKLTPLECLRLQGFPDDFKLLNHSETQIHKQIGNSVMIDVIQYIIGGIEQWF